MNNFKELRVWQSSMDTAVDIYHQTEIFPKKEDYGLTSQIRRAAVSIPSNIAEGFAREHRKEYLHHLSIAQGSASELETQVILANRLGYLSDDNFTALSAKIDSDAKQIRSLRVTLQRLEDSGYTKPQTPNPKP